MFLSKRSSSRVYYLFFEDELGKRQRISTHCRLKTDALKFLQSFKMEQFEKRVKLLRLSLGQFTADYLEHSKSIHTERTQEGVKMVLKQLRRFIGDEPLQRIGVREIERFLQHKKDEASLWTARKYYITLASAFETAKRWNLIADNPLRSVEKPKTPELEPLHFTKDEFRVLLKVVDDTTFKELCFCAVSTGLRLSELTALQWTDVDLVSKVIHVRNSATFTTKSKRNRVVPMNEQLWHIMASRKEAASCELVFHDNGRKLTKDEVSKRFKKYARQALGSETRLHFHSLRHTFASWLVQDGVSLYEVQKLLGHSNISVTEVYSHLQPEQLHETVNRIQISMN